MVAAYDRSLHCNGNLLRVAVEGENNVAFYNGREVARRAGEVGALLFSVMEKGERVTYDIAVLRSNPIRIFVGRNGRLIYSDDAAFAVDLTSSL